MEASSIVDLLAPATEAPQQEPKPLKAPAVDQDVQRFDAILQGEGPYQPKSLDLIMPATKPNAIQNLNQSLWHEVLANKKSSDKSKRHIEALMKKAAKGSIDVGDMLQLQMEFTNLTIETTMMSECGKRSGEGFKTMFRGQ